MDNSNIATSAFPIMDDDSRQLHLWTLSSGSSADCNLLPQKLFSARITLGRRHLVTLPSFRSSLRLLSSICFFSLRSHSPRCNVSILVTLLQHIICEFHYSILPRRSAYLCALMLSGTPLWNWDSGVCDVTGVWVRTKWIVGNVENQ